MDLSLDDIIRKKKISGAAGGASKKFIPKQSLPLRKTLNRPIVREAVPRIADARIKIIQNNRARIVDARDKLVEITRASGDARQRLQHLAAAGDRRAAPNKNGKPHQHHHALHHQDSHSSYRNGHGGGGRHMSEPLRKVVSGGGGSLGLRTKGAQYRAASSRDMEHSSHHEVYRRQANVVDIPLGYVDYDNMARMEEEEYAAATHLSRTVKNDMASHYDTYGPPLPPAARGERGMTPPAPRRLNSWGSTASEHFDPFDMYEVPHGGGRHERRMSPDLPPPPPKGILRPSSSSGGGGARQHSPNADLYQRRYIPENASHLSYEMRSRLEHAPDPHASMGIFSNPLKGSSSSSSTSGGTSSSGAAAHAAPTSVYRIVVSNLHTSVTTSDIKELFEDIGALFDSRIVRPGVAEVIYKQLADAEKAVDTYHNRQLDGQPMKCLLVNPRASNKPTAPAIKTSSSSSRLTSGKTPLEIDIDALHKVLFRRH